MGEVAKSEDDNKTSTLFEIALLNVIQKFNEKKDHLLDNDTSQANSSSLALSPVLSEALDSVLKVFKDENNGVEEKEEKVNVTQLAERNSRGEKNPVIFTVISEAGGLSGEKSVEKDYVREPAGETSAALLPKGALVTDSPPGLHRNLTEDIITIISEEEEEDYSSPEKPPSSPPPPPPLNDTRSAVATTTIAGNTTRLAHPAKTTNHSNGETSGKSLKKAEGDFVASELRSETEGYMSWLDSESSANASTAEKGQRFLELVTNLTKLIGRAPKILARNSTEDLRNSRDILSEMVSLSDQQAKQLKARLSGKQPVGNRTGGQTPEAKATAGVDVALIGNLKESNQSNQINQSARLFYQLQHNLRQLKEEVDRAGASKAEAAWLISSSLTIASQLEQVEWLREKIPLVNFELETLENLAIILTAASCLTHTSHWDECISVSVEDV